MHNHKPQTTNHNSSQVAVSHQIPIQATKIWILISEYSIMPLTPRFELSQTSKEVIVTVLVPTVRITNIEVLLEESILHFYASPYLLKLNFAPHEFAAHAQGIVSAQYTPSNQTVEIPLVKAQENVDWPNLELTARLLQPQEIPKKWLHSVETASEETSLNKEDQANQDIEAPPLNSSSSGYGFQNTFQNIFSDYCRSGMAQEMLQLPDPENTSAENRRELRIQKELEDFDPDRYLQDWDLHEDFLYSLVLDFEPFWKQPEVVSQKQTEHNNKNGDSDVADLAQQFQRQLNLDLNSTQFTPEERLQLSTIPYPLIPCKDIDNLLPLWFGLLDLLVPYVYDHLTTMGEPTVESAWTITILSSGLSWLDPPQTLDEALVSLSRRMLIYPYWRNWEFAMSVWDHVLFILEQGIHSVIKCLLQVRNILEKSESYYVGNKLWTDPFLYWIQNLQVYDSNLLVDSLRRELGKKELLKGVIGLDLIQYENMLQDSSASESEFDSDGDSSEGDGDSDESSSDSASKADSGATEETPKTARDTNYSEDNKTHVSRALLDSEVGGAYPAFLEVVGSHGEATSDCEGDVHQSHRKPLIQEIE